MSYHYSEGIFGLVNMAREIALKEREEEEDALYQRIYNNVKERTVHIYFIFDKERLGKLRIKIPDSFNACRALLAANPDLGREVECVDLRDYRDRVRRAAGFPWNCAVHYRRFVRGGQWHVEPCSMDEYPDNVDGSVEYIMSERRIKARLNRE